MLNDFFVVNPFKPIWYIILFVGIIFCIVFIRSFINKPERKKKNAIIILYIIAIMLFVIYKVVAVNDVRYFELCSRKGLEPMKFWDELPFHLCNFNMILILLAVIFNLDYVYGFVFFFSTLGAIMAIMMPTPINYGATMFEPTIWGFYSTHLLVAMEMPIIYFFNLYKPKYKDIPIVLSFLFVLDIVFTVFNLVLRATGLSHKANYFFTIEPLGNPVLEIFYKWIHIPGIYLLPCAIILLPYMLFVTYYIVKIEKIKKRCYRETMLNENISENKIINKYRLNRNRSIFTLITCIIIAIIVFVTVIIGVINNFPVSYNYFFYFTTNSNIIAAIATLFTIPFAVEGIWKQKFILPRWIFLLLFCGVVYVVATTIATFTLILPVSGMDALTGNNFVFHIVCPILIFILFNVVGADQLVFIKDCILCAIPYILYAFLYFVMVAFVGENNGGWSDFYHIFDIVPVWMAALFVALIFAGSTLINVLIHNGIVRSRQKKFAEMLVEKYKPENGYDIKFVLFEMGEMMSINNTKDEIVIPIALLKILQKNYKNVSLKEMVDIYVKGAFGNLC